MTKKEILAAELGFVESDKTEGLTLLVHAFISRNNIANLILLTSSDDTLSNWTLTIQKIIVGNGKSTQADFGSHLVRSIDELKTKINYFKAL